MFILITSYLFFSFRTKCFFIFSLVGVLETTISSLWELNHRLIILATLTICWISRKTCVLGKQEYYILGVWSICLAELYLFHIEFYVLAFVCVSMRFYMLFVFFAWEFSRRNILVELKCSAWGASSINWVP